MTANENRSAEMRSTLNGHIWLVLGAALLAAAAVLPLSLTRTLIYEASARLLIQRTTVDPVTGSELSSDPARVIQTEALVVTSREVRAQVEAELGRAPMVVVEPLAQSDVLSIVAEASEPAEAAKIANAYAAAYVDYRRDELRSRLRTVKRDFSDELSLLDQALAAEPDENRRVQLQARIDTLQNRLDDVTAQQAAASAGAILLNPASAPGRAGFLVVLRDVVLAWIVGALLGFAVAAVSDRRSQLRTRSGDL